MARRDPSGTVYYSFADHLGTTRIITDPAGAIKRGMDFQPFGFEVVQNGLITDNYKFTGLERDTETGNDHTLFRQYAFNLGRWYTPDPLAGDILNPQSLNRYAYVMNNPTNFIDPLGLDGFAPYGPGGCTGGNCCPHPHPMPPMPPMPPGGGSGGDNGGGGGSTGDVWGQDAPAIPSTTVTFDPSTKAFIELTLGTIVRAVIWCGGQPACWVPVAAVGAVGVVYAVYRIDKASKTKVPTVPELQRNCTPGRRVVEPSTSRPGWTSVEQEYICNGVSYTVQCFVSPTGAVTRDCQGPPKGGGG